MLAGLMREKPGWSGRRWHADNWRIHCGSMLAGCAKNSDRESPDCLRIS